MPRFRKYLVSLKYVILVSLFINIYFQYNSRLLVMVLFFIFSSALMINDYMRIIKLKNHTSYMYISLLFSICGAAILKYFVNGLGPSFYIFFSLAELFRLRKSMLKIFFSIHSLLFFAVYILKNGLPTTMVKLSSLCIALLGYFGIASIAYSIKLVQLEKEEVNQLNEKLKLANIKLQEYALQVEELTVSRERTRVAQELHDSLGHSLMALTMHLEFAKKIYDIKPDKVKDALLKSESIAKTSINDLRKAVNLLNEKREIKNLNNSIEELINNFHLFGNIKITFNKDKNIDNLSSIIKTSIYKTVQESITNSLKHGNATEINIRIATNNECVKLVITDNGIGCTKIIKSNGLTGIENRIAFLNGTVGYFSHNNLGFGITAYIPI